MKKANQKTNTSEIKNRVVLFVGSFEKKERKELFNFSKIDHYYEPQTGVSYIRILCGNSFTYFKTVETVISEIETF